MPQLTVHAVIYAHTAQATGLCATMHSGGQRFDAITEFGDSAGESDMADAR